PPTASGRLHSPTGRTAAAAASGQQAVQLERDLGYRIGEAQALNSLGELSSRPSATGQARAHHNRALAIARDIGLPLEEARALEGTGHSYLQDGDSVAAAICLRQALTIYQRIGAPAAQRVQETLEHHRLTPVIAESPPTTPTGQGHQP